MADLCVPNLARRGPRLNAATHAITLMPTDVDGIPRIVAYFPNLATVKVHLPLLFEVERSSPDAAEDADLVPRLVHGAVAVYTLGNRQCMALLRQRESRDQPGSGPGTEAVIAGRLGRRELDDPEAVLAIGKVRKLTDVRDAQLDVVKIVDTTSGIEHLIDPGLLRTLDIQDDQSSGPRCDVGVGPGHVKVAASCSGSIVTGLGCARSVMSSTFTPSSSQAKA